MKIIVLLLLVVCSGQIKFVSAQPLEDWPVLETETKAGQEFNALRSETRLLMRDNPAEAIARYQQFLQEHPDIKPATGVSVALTIGQVQARRLKDSQAALETYKSAFEKYADAPNKFALLAPQAVLLQEIGKAAEAEVLLAAHWDEALTCYYDDPRTALTTVGPMMQQYIHLLEIANRHEEIITRLTRAMLESPALLDEDMQGTTQATGWMYDALIDQLLALKRTDEALSWAKLRFMQCYCYQAAINRAVSTLALVWRAQGAAGEAALRAFVESQNDTARLNPLAAVPLPRVDAGHLALLARSSLVREAAFNVQLLTGALGQAMIQAHDSLQKPAAIMYSVRSVARVFKAADLNVQRANAFMAAFTNGGGAELVQKFLAEHAPAGPATVNTPPDAKRETAALKAFMELQARTAELERTSPVAAIARYRSFNDEQPDLPLAVGVLLSAKIAGLYQQINETDTALAIYDWALQRYGEYPESLRLILDRARLWAAKEAAIPPLKIVLPLR